MGKIRLVAILGPTASGKSEAALTLAEAFGGEVVSADSMQVFRFMDIGTAKPSRSARQRVRHHVIDIINPDHDYSAVIYRNDALKSIVDIDNRGKVPILAGGTGLYIKALLNGIFAGPGKDSAIRQRLKSTAEEKGASYLHEMLKGIDPESAMRIHPNNTVRIIRAIEVCESTGKRLSDLQRGHGFSEGGMFEAMKIGLFVEREALYKAIDQRVDEMIKQGLVQEARWLIENGYGTHLKSMQSIGYKEAGRHIMGEAGLPETIHEIKKNTRHFAKRQVTWFKRDEEIRWFPARDSSGIIEAVKGFLN